MKLTHIKKAGIVLASIMIATTAQAYNPKFECMKKITNYGHGHYFPEGPSKIEDRGHRSYRVKGKALDTRDNKHYPYVCKIRHGEVVDWRVTHSNNDAAKVVGAGVLIAAIAAAANQEKHNNHATGGSAFDDMRYLKKQCRQNIRHHISNDEQKVRKIKLDTARLDRRTLKGKGGVEFRNGGGSAISYECKFDRQGRIYDGHYRFQDYASTPSTKDIVGARGRDGENMLTQRGFNWKRTTKIDNSSYTFWEHRKSKQCIRVQTANGRYRSIVNTPADDCR